jgi:hypothetical protein
MFEKSAELLYHALLVVCTFYVGVICINYSPHTIFETAARLKLYQSQHEKIVLQTCVQLWKDRCVNDDMDIVDNLTQYRVEYCDEFARIPLVSEHERETRKTEFGARTLEMLTDKRFSTLNLKYNTLSKKQLEEYNDFYDEYQRFKRRQEGKFE